MKLKIFFQDQIFLRISSRAYSSARQGLLPDDGVFGCKPAITFYFL